MDTKREHSTHAEGSPRGNPYDLTYSPSGRLIGKFRENNSVTLSATVDMAYGYCDDYQPHAVKRMFDYNSGMLYDMRWDEAGNLGQVSIANPGEMFETGRFLYWTEDNRMHAAVDDRYYSYYAYDHSGERRLKLTGDNKLLDVNADFMATYTILNEPTLYPSAYMVLTNKGYTNVAKAESRASLLALPRRSSVTVRKHYYAGTERVAARLGGGGLDAIGHAIGNDEELQVKADVLFKQSLEQVNHRVLHENDLDCIMHNDFAKEEFGHWIDGIPYQMQAGVEPNHDQFKDMVNSMLDDINHGQENEVYFYHSDLCKSREQSQAGLSYAETQQSVRSKHLGSASWITDFSGMAVQHLQYLPYGEPYINLRLSGYSERFTFSGKERDEETGYGYFGARYMDHEMMTMWLSVDPMADKYPSLSSYAYCGWNPVKLVDPDGNDWYQKTYANGNTSIVYCKDKASCPKDGRYLGQAYIVFEGSSAESPVDITGQDGKPKRSITAPGAIAANVTVYGPNGENDIQQYTGYTMTSNPDKYGPIAEGEYVGRSDGNKGGALPSNFWIYDKNARKTSGGKDCCYMQGERVNTNPDAKKDWNYKTIYKTGIFIHSTGLDGNLGSRNSTGCLLISDKQWDSFKRQMKGVTNYTVQVTRLYPD